MTDNKGWECPRCHKIHAPWKPGCDCPSEAIQKWETDKAIEKGAEEFIKKLREQKAQEKCDHQWTINVETNQKKCVECGIDARSVACVGGWL